MNWLSKALNYLFSRPHVVGKGTSNGWKYTKWSDGTFDAVLNITNTVTFTNWATISGNLKLYHGAASPPALPSGLTIKTIQGSLVSYGEQPSGVGVFSPFLKRFIASSAFVGAIASTTLSSFSVDIVLGATAQGTWQ